MVITGDYKTEPDRTAPAFELVPCDVFVTEATFGLPVFRHGPAEDEIAKLLASVAANPGRCHRRHLCARQSPAGALPAARRRL